MVLGGEEISGCGLCVEVVEDVCSCAGCGGGWYGSRMIAFFPMVRTHC